jgi:hypothetical protein
MHLFGELRFQPFDKKIFIERKFACNLEHIKNIIDAILLVLHGFDFGACCIFLLVLLFTSTMTFGNAGKNFFQRLNH